MKRPLLLEFFCQAAVIILGAIVIYPHNVFMGIPTLTFYFLVGQYLGTLIFKK